ncbi:MAG: HD domain-containing phosphohydrolase [candidate division WOR-3 bacterium]
MQKKGVLINPVSLLLPSCTQEDLKIKLKTLRSVLYYSGFIVRDSRNGLIFYDFAGVNDGYKAKALDVESIISGLFVSSNVRLLERKYFFGDLLVITQLIVPLEKSEVNSDFVALLIESLTRDIVMFNRLYAPQGGVLHKLAISSQQSEEMTFPYKLRGSNVWKSHFLYVKNRGFKIAGICKLKGKIVEGRLKNKARWHLKSELTSAEDKFWNTLKEKGDPLYCSVKLILTTVKNKDFNTYQHLVNVAKLTGLIAREMGFKEEEVFWIQLAGLVHDIGKIVLPLEILTKPSELSEPEKDLLKLHVKYADEILRENSVFSSILPYVCQHHERCDGSGYPRGLHQREISDGVFPLIMADVVDAMLSDRPYRRAYKINEVIDILEKDKNVKFPSDAVDVTIGILKFVCNLN